MLIGEGVTSFTPMTLTGVTTSIPALLDAVLTAAAAAVVVTGTLGTGGSRFLQ